MYAVCIMMHTAYTEHTGLGVTACVCVYTGIYVYVCMRMAYASDARIHMMRRYTHVSYEYVICECEHVRSYMRVMHIQGYA